jgi:hypothetical protein
MEAGVGDCVRGEKRKGRRGRKGEEIMNLNRVTYFWLECKQILPLVLY